MASSISIFEFEEILPTICDAETSLDPDGWTAENPLWGHCAVVSLVAQNLFGGELMRASLEDTPFAAMRSHYFNKIYQRDPMGHSAIFDFTAGQFGSSYPEKARTDYEPRTREYLLSNENTAKRYRLLTWRLMKEVTAAPIFDDPIYKILYDHALQTGCQKLGFAAGLVINDVLLYPSNNHPIEVLKSMCEPECIRIKIQSRTESMIGACGHAEEFTLAKAHAEPIIDLSRAQLYVVGVDMKGFPLLKTKSDFTCLRCAVQIFNANVGSINVAFPDNWQSIRPVDALVKAKDYALGEKVSKH